ncbi:sensor histidine kinase [Campylobacter sp. RM12647]|uniref:sensor histidine kinase n=1 Tax=Campylobacter sp. RM12647 TaxID=2735737 RepID=UPI001D8C356B|nr:HAMP domain-containing histidine kinase [Campylobacter sp. RM12647]
MNKNILDSLDLSDKQSFADGLKALIEQTYVVENEYKALKTSYDSLMLMINEIIEILPSAIWVLDENQNLVVKNKLASDELFRQIDLNKEHYELEFLNNFYQIKSIKYADKHLIMATNITKEKRDERLVSMGQVAANLAHEIRNPIGSVSLLAGVLFSKVELKNKHIVMQMQDAIKRVERIIESTLLFTRGFKLNKYEFNLQEFENECQNVFNTYNNSDEIILSECTFAPFTISADKSLISLVLSNLIYNAIDACEENGTIKVKGEIINNIYKISVFDSGEKIANLTNLFEAFNTTKLKGNGLGLALCKQICNAHDANIYYCNEPKSFCVEFKLDI